MTAATSVRPVSSLHAIDVPEPTQSKDAGRSRSGRIKRSLAAVLAAVAVVGAGSYAYAQRGIESTDDAQIDADVVPVPARTSGVVTAIHFTDNQKVKAGDLLVEIDPAPAQARLAQADAELASAQGAEHAAEVEAQIVAVNATGEKSAAQASLAGAAASVGASSQQIAEAQAGVTAARANADKAKIDLDRARSLESADALPKAQLDAAQTTYDTAVAAAAQAEARLASLRAGAAQVQAHVNEASAKLTQASAVGEQIAAAEAEVEIAKAKVATAQAARDLAALELSYTKVYAPRDGFVSKRAVAVGQNVAPGSAVLMLVPSDQVWVTGNFKETQLKSMHAGERARFSIDAYGGRELEGEVESFSAATGAKFALLPPDNATGNYTKVVQRVPVRVRILNAPADLPLRPGMSVELNVDTRR